MAAATSDLQSASAMLISLRDLIVKDTIAIRKWSSIVDGIVKEPADVIRIKSLLDYTKIEEAVLQSLQVWYSYGDEREDLMKVFRNQGFNALAGAILESEYSALLGEIKLTHRKGDGLWFEVVQVVSNFTGRESQLKNVHKKLVDSGISSQESNTTNVVSISGLGGIGKSTLARKYAFTYRKFYDGNVIWINAETVDSMRGSFVRLARRLGVQGEDQLSNEELATQAFSHFRAKKCLFIFDNVEEKSEFKHFQPKILHPDHAVPFVLVTSRRTDLNPLPANEIRLDVLKIEESVELIQTQLLKSTEENATKLAEKLQRLPLALQQALAYIRDKYIDEEDSTLKYLKEFDKSEADLLKDDRFKEHTPYSSTTFTAWAITLRRIKDMSDGASAIKLINTASHLNPDLISLSFLKTIFDDETEPGLKLLTKFSMLHVSDGKVFIHRLVQYVVRLSLSGQEESAVVLPIMSAIDQELQKGIFSDLARECISHALHSFPSQVRQLELMNGEFEPGYFSRLCYFLLNYGSFEQCLSTSQQASILYTSFYGEEHENTMRMKCRVAEILQQNFFSKHSDSIQILNSILPTAKSKFGTEHELTIDILLTLAEALSRSEDSAKAILVFDKILPTAERVLGENDLRVLGAKYNKALRLRQLGHLDEALILIQYVHEKEVALFGDSDVRTLWSKFQLGLTHFLCGELSKTLEIWKQVEKEFRNEIGETHPKTLSAQWHLAALKRDLAQLVIIYAAPLRRTLTRLRLRLLREIKYINHT